VRASVDINKVPGGSQGLPNELPSFSQHGQLQNLTAKQMQNMAAPASTLETFINPQ
jgi:hypothetical protein